MDKKTDIELTLVWAGYLCDLLRTEVDCLILDTLISASDFKRISDWFNGRVLNLCQVHGECTNTEDINRFFENRKFSIRQLRLYLNLSPEVTPLNFGNFEIDQFYMSNDNSETINGWVTVESVLNLNCILMWMGNCFFTWTDLNRIVKGWITGKISRMEYFLVSVPHFDLRSLLQGIEFEKIDNTLVRAFIPKSERTRDPEGKILIVGGYDIRRNDGTIATIQLRAHPWRDTILCDFEMVVWD